MVNVPQVSRGIRMIEGGSPSFNNLSIADGGFLFESAVSGVTATASGTQATSVQLSNEMTRVTTVATAGDGILLPASVPGLTIYLENAAALAMSVFAAGTDTINGNAAATGVTQMAGSMVIYTCYAAGAWFAQGLGTGYSGSLETQSTTTGITAHAGGTQALGVALTTMANNVTVCATGGDSVVLPATAAGLQISVANNGAASCNVFPPVGSTMNGTLNAASALAAASVGLYFGVTATAWISK